MNATCTIPRTTVSAAVKSAQAISGRQCPTCRSWETRRHVEGFRVWFTCDTCGCIFS
jgi:hypothetical protein